MPRSTAKSSTPRRASAKKPAAAPIQYEMRGLSDQLPWGVFVPPDQVTAEVAIRVTAILACVRFLACAIASMPAGVMRTLDNGRKAIASDLRFYDVLTRSPNSWQSQYEYMETTVYHCALHGNAYSRIVSGEQGFCSALEPLHPSRMQVRRMDDSTLGYSYLYPNGKWVQFDQTEIVHYRWISDNSFIGLVPAELCGTSVALARKLDVAASSFWDNSARPDVVIETQETIPEPAVAELRRQWREMYGGARRRGSAAVLPKKVQVKTLDSNSMESSQFQELRDSIVTEVARCFGVPSTLIGDRLMNRWSTVEQEFLTAQVFCLLPWQRRIESAIERSILATYPGTYYRLDNRGLLRADTAARVSLYQAMWQMGAISPNEVRALEDLPLLDDKAADQTYVQLGFSTLAAAAAQGNAADSAADPKDVAPSSMRSADHEFRLEVMAPKQSEDDEDSSSTQDSSMGNQEDSSVAGSMSGEPESQDGNQDSSVDAPAGGGPVVDLPPMNGKQLEALVGLLAMLADGDLSKDQAAAAMAVAFPMLDAETVKALVTGAAEQQTQEGDDVGA